MVINGVNQAYNFIIFILNGFAIGIIFDIFRILRRSFKTSDFITCIEDISFWILSGLLTIFSITIFNYGEIRFYIFIAIIIGVIIYMLTISKYFIKFNVTIITFLKNIILKPITFIYTKIKNLLSNFVKSIAKTKENIKKYKKNNKNAIQKKDFKV